VVNGVEHKYETFNGKELEESLGLNVIEMDFRQYDPALGRFNVTDPMAEERNWLSPYNFVQNNPISRVDPTGLLDDYGVDDVGNVELIKKTDDDTDTLYSVTRGEDGELVKDENGDVAKNTEQGSVTIDKNKDGSSILSDLSSNSIITVPGSQKNDLFKTFGFLADNTKVEWSVIKYELMPDSPDYQLGTFRNDDSSPQLTGYRSKGKWLGMVHSHPNQPTNQDRLDSVYGDNDVGTRYLTKYGANKPYLIYFPDNKTTSKIRLGKPAFGRRTIKPPVNLKSFKF
jgi:RHS repeat-associated protein